IVSRTVTERSGPSNTPHRPFLACVLGALSKHCDGSADSAIEYKHQNVGAVMIKSGFACIRGYKPMGNSRTLFLIRQVRKTAGSPRRQTGGLIPAQFALYALALP